MQVESLRRLQAGSDIDVKHESGENDMLIVTPQDSLSPGTYDLIIEFSNDFNTDGVGINRTEHEGAYYIFSQFEAVDARQAFPCFDELGFKFPWQLTMMVPEDVLPITNTPEASVTVEDGNKTVVFEATPPLIKITVHELAHQWFGNLVTMQWWDDLWLNESFADWLGDKIVDRVYSEYDRGMAELLTTFRIMDTDARPTTKPIRHEFKATDNFSDGIFLSYYKGKAVISMFEKAVGEDVFRDGVIRYLREFSRANAAAADLWAQINSGAEFDLAGGLASFIDQPGIPLISVTASGGGRYEFSQSRLLTGGDAAAMDQTWVIPLNYKYWSDGRVVTAEMMLSDKTQSVHLGTDVAWILPNANQSGYYRWNIPPEMLISMGEDAALRLNVRERMGMLTNLWSLLATDKIDGDDLLAALQGMSTDVDASVVSALLGQLGNILQTRFHCQTRSASRCGSKRAAVIRPCSTHCVSGLRRQHHRAIDAVTFGPLGPFAIPHWFRRYSTI